MTQRSIFSTPLRRVSTSLFLLAALSLPAHAATILADGGFESATGGAIIYAGSSIDGGSWNVTQGSVYIDSGDPYVFAGNNSLNLTGNNPYFPNTISQTLATVAGQLYSFSFFANADSSNTFALLVNGLAVSGAPSSIANNGFPGAVSNSALFTSYNGQFTANSTSTVFSISDTATPPYNSQYGSVVFDNFNIAPTPEPGSILLVLTGVAGLGQAVRRRFLTR